ncbi:MULTISPECIES: AAA family ATPase [Bacillota]|uniref:AAA family ATPase n=6 Tax=Erysipelotrichaceae TaxID=128827 RepID=A0A7G9GMY6_9FIRM|nr:MULTISPECIES: AAA family ATPase [Bacillota]QNM12168.1 AAA family ATPase [[Eubacterium] hominis]
MDCLEEIIKKIGSCKNGNIRVNFKELKEAVALEEELKRRGIPFVMDIRLTNTGCNAVIGREKRVMYEKDVKDLHVEEANSIYHVEKSKEKRVPIGISDYREIKKENAYCVDKTKMIEELLQLNDQVTLITRPRRFGKTLNMSMLAEFFDITKDSRELFKDTYIYRTKYVKEMNKWPVIFLSFFDCKGNENIMIGSLIEHLEDLYAKYYPIYKTFDEKELRDKLCQTYEELKKGNNFSNVVFIKNSLNRLIEFLNKEYQKKVILLIDEYDTPFMSAYAGKYYDHVKDILRGLLLKTLKDNSMLYKGVLTGIQRIAKESLFSDLNNLEVCTMQEDKYADMFGFTEEETRALLESHHLKLSEEVKSMYDGYRIGNKEIYNPWSIVKYASSGKLKRYWVNTGGNQIIKDSLKQVSQSFFDDYQELIETGSVEVICDLESNYQEEETDNYLWALLINAGFLTIIEEIQEGDYIVRIVNGETRAALSKMMLSHLKVDEKKINKMLQALTSKDMPRFKELYTEILKERYSYYDLDNEKAHHILLVLLLDKLHEEYEIHSNQETGTGRCDIFLKSRKQKQDIIIELKYLKSESYQKDTTNSLKKEAEKALKQIIEEEYAPDAFKVGIAYHGKHMDMAWK